MHTKNDTKTEEESMMGVQIKIKWQRFYASFSCCRRSFSGLLKSAILIVFLATMLATGVVTTGLAEETQDISVRGVPKSTWKATRLEALRLDMSASQLIIKLLNDLATEINERKTS